MNHQLWQISQRKKKKNILRLRLWWVPAHRKSLAIAGKKDGKYFSDNSKESLLMNGEVSDGRRGKVEVPKGFVAVYVGPELRRFVIPASYLSMPEFRVLMERVGEEFGFEQEGALQIPCEEEAFEEILLSCLTLHQMMSKSKKKKAQKNDQR